MTEEMVSSWWEQLIPYFPAMGGFLADESVSEIEVNPNGDIYIEVAGDTTRRGEQAAQHSIEAFVHHQGRV